jgi:hypothetical protein
MDSGLQVFGRGEWFGILLINRTARVDERCGR